MAKKYQISKTSCNKCGGLISWDEYPNVKYPIHVDSSGNRIGNGSCPSFNNLIYTTKSNEYHVSNKTASPSPIKKKAVRKDSFDLRAKIGVAALGIVVILCIVIPVGINSIIHSGTTPDNPESPDPPPPPPPPQFQWEIDAQGDVTNIVDGDTYDMTSIGRVRLADIDCPDQGEAGCEAATSYMTSLIDGKHVYVDIDDVYQTDVYGRYVCVTYVRYNSTHLLNVNKDLLVRGYATIWNFNNEFDPYEWPLYVYYTS